MITHIEVKEKFEISSKRFYLPISINLECPNCTHVHKTNLEKEYLTYPTLNEKTEMYCYCDECDTEFEFDITLKVSIEVDTDTRKL